MYMRQAGYMITADCPRKAELRLTKSFAAVLALHSTATTPSPMDMLECLAGGRTWSKVGAGNGNCLLNIIWREQKEV